MRRFGVQCMALVMTIIAPMAAAQASSQELVTNRRTAGDDPAVMAFRIFVVGKDLSTRQIAQSSSRPLIGSQVR